MCLIRDRIWLQVAPTPSTGNGWPPAGTVQRPFICESFSQRHQVRPVTVRAEARQISSEAFWALNAMANTGSHGSVGGSYGFRLIPFLFFLGILSELIAASAAWVIPLALLTSCHRKYSGSRRYSRDPE